MGRCFAGLEWLPAAPAGSSRVAVSPRFLGAAGSRGHWLGARLLLATCGGVAVGRSAAEVAASGNVWKTRVVRLTRGARQSSGVRVSGGRECTAFLRGRPSSGAIDRSTQTVTYGSQTAPRRNRKSSRRNMTAAWPRESCWVSRICAKGADLCKMRCSPALMRDYADNNLA